MPQQVLVPAQPVYVPMVAVPQQPQQPPTDNMAVTSLVLGIFSVIAFSILAGIPAIIVGKQARENIRASNGALAGESMARAGIIMGWVSVVLFGLAALVLIVVLALIFV
jgi:hypothetical protein